MHPYIYIHMYKTATERETQARKPGDFLKIQGLIKLMNHGHSPKTSLELDSN